MRRVPFFRLTPQDWIAGQEAEREIQLTAHKEFRLNLENLDFELARDHPVRSLGPPPDPEKERLRKKQKLKKREKKKKKKQKNKTQDKKKKKRFHESGSSSDEDQGPTPEKKTLKEMFSLNNVLGREKSKKKKKRKRADSIADSEEPSRKKSGRFKNMLGKISPKRLLPKTNPFARFRRGKKAQPQPAVIDDELGSESMEPLRGNTVAEGEATQSMSYALP